LLIPAITTSLESLAQDPYFRTFNSNNGLAGNEVYEALQDHKGYIWFCTNRGVSRFDGKNFVNFSTANGLGETPSLAYIRVPMEKYGAGVFPVQSHTSKTIMPNV
jgi:ligand-binding sensor domain-containing protein